MSHISYGWQLCVTSGLCGLQHVVLFLHKLGWARQAECPFNVCNIFWKENKERGKENLLLSVILSC